MQHHLVAASDIKHSGVGWDIESNFLNAPSLTNATASCAETPSVH